MKRAAILGVLMATALGSPTWAKDQDQNLGPEGAYATVNRTVNLGEKQKSPLAKTGKAQSKAGVITSIAPPASSAMEKDQSKLNRLTP